MNKLSQVVCAVMILIAPVITEASEQPALALDNYFKYLNTYTALGPIGDASKGEIEIVQDRQKIKEIEAQTGRMVGVVAEDKYWVWINDAVKFPNNKYGVYGRMQWKCNLNTDGGGAAVLPILPNGKIALIRNFRHATRSWEYELPGGAMEPNETFEETARRELKEETGLIAKEISLLGKVAVDPGTLNSVTPIFLAIIADTQTASPEDSEAIASVDAFSIAEIKQGFIDGYLIVDVKGREQKVPLRSAGLAYAILMLELRG